MSPTRIIVPHRGLAAAKTRLAPVLDHDERIALARTLLIRVLGVARQARDDVVVISPSAELDPIVTDSGARLAVQRDGPERRAGPGARGRWPMASSGWCCMATCPTWP